MDAKKEEREAFEACEATTAKQKYDECMKGSEEPSPLERLRFFCSLAMNGQDWLDSEKLFDDLAAWQKERRNDPEI